MFEDYKFNILLPSQYNSIVGLYVTWVGHLLALQNYECKHRVLDDFFIIFVSSGAGIFRCEGIEYTLEKNDAFFLFPGVVHYYATDPQRLLELWWIGFSGPNAQKLLNDMGLDPDKCILKDINSSDVFDTIKEIVENSLESSSGITLKSSGNLYIFFGLLMDYYPKGEDSPGSISLKFTKPIERALAFIEANYPYEISIKQMAEYVGLSGCHFAIRFKYEVGSSPSEQLAKIRLRQAKYYLSNSDLSITEVAHSVGFQDPQYFSRFFKIHEGVSTIQFKSINGH